MDAASGDARPLYHRFAWAYDQLFPESVDARVAGIEVALRTRGVPAGRWLLDAGCGTGRYVLALAGRGFRVLGVDRSLALLAQAHGRGDGGAAGFAVGDLRALPLVGPVGAVLCRGVLNDLTADDDRDRALREFARVLAPGGVVLLDVRDWAASARRYAARPVFERTVVLLDGTLRFRSETRLEAAGQRLVVRERFELDRTAGHERADSGFVMRCWSPAELEGRARAAGFRAVERLPGYGAAAAGTDLPDRLVAALSR